MIKEKNRPLTVFIANPRGFCAGVERAIAIVEKSLEKYGAPIYIKHEIVHNKYVVDDLRAKGAIFVEDVAEIPDDALTIYSAHGVSQAVEDASQNKNLKIFDATCPLVKKVHNQVVKLDDEAKEIILIGHEGHPEVEGTSGRSASKVRLVQNLEDVATLEVKDPDNLGYVSQTTLSVDDTKDIIAALRARFPNISGPNSDDICYATQNRQDAVKQIVEEVDLLLTIGATNSSNSNRLRDIGHMYDKPSYLISSYQDIDLAWFSNVAKVGVTAGASAPEILVEEVLDFLRDNFKISLVEKSGKKENIMFNLPRELRS